VRGDFEGFLSGFFIAALVGIGLMMLVWSAGRASVHRQVCEGAGGAWSSDGVRLYGDSLTHCIRVPAPTADSAEVAQ
jgi:hypothetical protein